MKYQKVDLKKLEEIAKSISKKIKNGGIVLLEGNLGSGKTQMSKFIAKHLNIKQFSIKSPTYTFYKSYQLDRNQLIHYDLYRLEEEDMFICEELDQFLISKKNIILIEWPSKIKNFLKATHQKKIKINLKITDNEYREIQITEL